MKADRDHAVRMALKQKVPIFEIAKDFKLSEAEIGAIISEMGGGPKKDDLLDAREEESKIALLRRGRR